jgi:hypothetical protein
MKLGDVLTLVDSRWVRIAVVTLVACSAGPTSTARKEIAPPAPTVAPSAAAPVASTPAEPLESGAIPQRCAEGQAEGICAPPKAFVQSLCGSYPKPDIALILFSKSSPFSHVYLNRNMEGWYSSGQQSTSAKLMFDEEVIVLAHPKSNKTGMVIGTGESNYDVLRLDGVCSSVEPEAITHKRPPSPKYASVPWQQLEQNVRDALLQDPTIEKADAARRRECKGTTSLGILSPACAKADDKLSATIAAYVVRGGATPLPKASR